jgi:hypothetical protein
MMTRDEKNQFVVALLGQLHAALGLNSTPRTWVPYLNWTVSADTLSKWARGKSLPNEKSVARVRSYLAQLAPPAKKAPSALPPTTKRIVNHVCIVMDDSGSMGSISQQAWAALSRTVQDLRDAALRTGQETLLSLVMFGSSVEARFVDVPVSRAVLPTHYDPQQSSTALWDGIAGGIDAIERHGVLSPGADVSYLVIVITDGGENSSRRTTHRGLNERIAQLVTTDRWTVTAQVPPRTKSNFLACLPAVGEGNVEEWEQTVRGVEVAAQSRSAGISTYVTARASGQTSVRTFYTDASGLTSQAVQNHLTDVSSQVTVWEVKKEADIRPFVEARTPQQPYVPGAAFYQLTKTEKKVQPYKQLLIMKKGEKNVYGGAEARRLLGLPGNDTVRIVPRNHGDWDIFVQSTSVNRKLVRGTRLLYSPHMAAGGLLGQKLASMWPARR